MVKLQFRLAQLGNCVGGHTSHACLARVLVMLLAACNCGPVFPQEINTQAADSLLQHASKLVEERQVKEAIAAYTKFTTIHLLHPKTPWAQARIAELQKQLKGIQALERKEQALLQLWCRLFSMIAGFASYNSNGDVCSLDKVEMSIFTFPPSVKGMSSTTSR